MNKVKRIASTTHCIYEGFSVCGGRVVHGRDVLSEFWIDRGRKAVHGYFVVFHCPPQNEERRWMGGENERTEGSTQE